jgi:ABC-type bacteriocin/lantibiotic exporters, contain an N-terminal double-glycine peptidase domain
MTLHKGEKLGITGASGIGKTTLFNMLLGFYSPRKGSITIDGVPLDNTNMSLWHDLISYVPQDVFLMDGTIAENVAFGFDESEIDHEKLMDTLTRVSLFDFVSSLEKGIDTQIGENGCRLSEGQRQRIGIARALYKKAKVLFLDEATSSLDFRTESDVIDTIRELSNRDKELTIVMITHRVSTLDFCDRVIKMVK